MHCPPLRGEEPSLVTIRAQRELRNDTARVRHHTTVYFSALPLPAPQGLKELLGGDHLLAAVNPRSTADPLLSAPPTSTDPAADLLPLPTAVPTLAAAEDPLAEVPGAEELSEPELMEGAEPEAVVIEEEEAESPPPPMPDAPVRRVLTPQQRWAQLAVPAACLKQGVVPTGAHPHTSAHSLPQSNPTLQLLNFFHLFLLPYTPLARTHFLTRFLNRHLGVP